MTFKNVNNHWQFPKNSQRIHIKFLKQFPKKFPKNFLKNFLKNSQKNHKILKISNSLHRTKRPKNLTGLFFTKMSLLTFKDLEIYILDKNKQFYWHLLSILILKRKFVLSRSQQILWKKKNQNSLIQNLVFDQMNKLYDFLTVMIWRDFFFF